MKRDCLRDQNVDGRIILKQMLGRKIVGYEMY
jgi:hypothetical protein